MQKITPFLWFDGNAEEAARFYASVFRDAKIKGIMHYNEAVPNPKGTVLTVTLELFGQEYVALNGGPQYAFTPAVSFMVTCQDQKELDSYWDKLADGGKPIQCSPDNRPGWRTRRPSRRCPGADTTTIASLPASMETSSGRSLA